MRTITRTKQPKVYLHSRKLILSRSERLKWEQATEYYVKLGYPLETAKQYAWDHTMIDRRAA